MADTDKTHGQRLCPCCDRPVHIDKRGALLEHFRPRLAADLFPVGCVGSNHTVSAGARIALELSP